MGKVIKFPGRLQLPSQEAPQVVGMRKRVISILIAATKAILYWSLVIVGWFLLFIFAFLVQGLLWALGPIVVLSFVVMIAMWSEPTYIPMLVFLGSFGLLIGILMLAAISSD